MLLKCLECGNTRSFSLCLRRYVRVKIRGGDVTIAPLDEEELCEGGDITCERCGSWEVEEPRGFRDKFWPVYDKALQEK